MSQKYKLLLLSAPGLIAILLMTAVTQAEITVFKLNGVHSNSHIKKFGANAAKQMGLTKKETKKMAKKKAKK